MIRIILAVIVLAAAVAAAESPNGTAHGMPKRSCTIHVVVGKK
jgi:hypothetical protein